MYAVIHYAFIFVPISSCFPECSTLVQADVAVSDCLWLPWKHAHFPACWVYACFVNLLVNRLLVIYGISA